mmetsp:Transcript_112205/g.298211  ORF Transcript_112205/g.298211 Transcript_112205/m.298211 type:complete len:268 (-) Transcript_112205:1266-2069(-)
MHADADGQGSSSASSVVRDGESGQEVDRADRCRESVARQVAQQLLREVGVLEVLREDPLQGQLLDAQHPPLAAGVPQHAWQDAGGVVLPVGADPGAWHALDALRELPEHGVAAGVLALLVQHVEALQVEQLLLALVQDLQELRIAHGGVRPLVLVVVAGPVRGVLLRPVPLAVGPLVLHGDPVLRGHEPEVRLHVGVVVVQHVVVEVQRARLLELPQEGAVAGLDHPRGALAVGRCLHLLAGGRRRAVQADAPHPHAVPDLRDVVVA